MLGNLLEADSKLTLMKGGYIVLYQLIYAVEYYVELII